MKISELLENRFDERQFIEKIGDKTELAYDLAEDLAYFLNNDDDTYRRHTYPTIVKNKKLSPNTYKKVVEDGYNNYKLKYPIKELPEVLDDDIISEVCHKLHEVISKDELK